MYVGDYQSAPDMERESMNFPLWLYVKHPNFLTKLVSCPLCLSFWTNLVCLVVTQGTQFTLMLWLACTYATLFAYTALDRLYTHG